MATVENVLLVVVDALRADRVGAYSGTNLTPNIDALATEGEVFEQCYSCINATDPSLTTILTGQYPTRHGLINHGERVTEEEHKNVSGTENIPERVCDTHTTIAADILERWHQRGFTYYLQQGMNSEQQRYYQIQARNILAGLVQRFPDILEEKTKKIYNCVWGSSNSQMNGEDVSEAILSTIDNSEDPWFALAHYWDTHLPYKPRKEYPDVIKNRSYEGGDMPLTEILATIEGSNWEASLRNGLLGNVDTVGDVKRMYDDAIHQTDQEVGRIVEHLKQIGEFENTAIIITSDHGESMTEHDIFFDHHGLYDQSLHVPLIIHAPNFTGKESSFVQHFDLAPTILDLLGRDYEREDFDGVSLVSSADDTRQLDRDAIYAEEAHTARRRCIRTDSFKYITRLDGRENCRYCGRKHASGDELYNLKEDPNEMENAIEEYPEVVTRLSDSLDSWINDLSSPNKGTSGFTRNQEVMQRLEDMGYR